MIRTGDRIRGGWGPARQAERGFISLPAASGRSRGAGGGSDRWGEGLAEEDFGFGVALGRDQLELAGGLGQGDTDDVGATQRHHHAERLVVHGLDRVHAEPGGQHTVERGRSAATLNVAEHGAAGLLAAALLDLVGQHLAYAARPGT